MERHNSAYIKLQKHLDNQAVGFPASRSGAELNILKHIFTSEEAEIACSMSYQFEPLESIHKRVDGRVGSAATNLHGERVCRAIRNRETHCLQQQLLVQR